MQNLKELKRHNLNTAQLLTMLKPKMSIQLKEYNAKHYIKEAMKNRQPQLSFVSEEANYQHMAIINIKIIQWLNKCSVKQNHILQLNLSTCNLNDRALEMLSKGHWGSLKELALFSNQLTSLSYDNLKKGSWKHLHKIDLGKNFFKNENTRSLAECSWFSLTHLDFSLNEASSMFLINLKENSWKKLKYLTLSKNNLSNMCLQILIYFQWHHLQSINLQNNNLTQDGMKILSKGRWKEIKYVYLNHNFIGYDGIRYLMLNKWTKLIRLEVISNLDSYGNFISLQHLYLHNLIKAKEFAKCIQKDLTIQLAKYQTSETPNPLLECLKQKKLSFLL